jgi:WD40 repeat protein
MRFSPDSSRVVAASWDGQIQVWDVGSGRRTRTMTSPEAAVDTFWISGDGRLAVAAGDLHYGGEVDSSMSGMASRNIRPPMSSGGPVFLGDSFVVRSWDLDSGECVLVMNGHTDFVTSVCMNPDDRVVVSSSSRRDGTIRLWDAATGACLQVLNASPTPRDRVAHAQCVRFSPDGRFVLAGHADATIRIWDVHSGLCAYTVSGHADAVTAVEVPADARLLLSRAANDDVRVWHLDWELSISD